MKKILISTFIILSFKCFAVCPTDSATCVADPYNSWDPVVGECTCGNPPTETPLDESAGMFAGAIVAMGAYILYRKRKQASQNK